MDARDLRVGLPVEYTAEDDEDLRRGHPGRVTDPRPEDVFLEWVGLETEPVSRWICYDLPALAVLDEATYAVRAERVRRGLPRSAVSGPYSRGFHSSVTALAAARSGRAHSSATRASPASSAPTTSQLRWLSA